MSPGQRARPAPPRCFCPWKPPLCLLELCDLLEVPPPDHHPDAGYFFEHPVTEHHLDGSTSTGRIDLYKRACFVLESKQLQEAQVVASELDRTV